MLNRAIFILLPGLLMAVHAASATGRSGETVYVIEITDEVDLGLAPYVRRVLAEAEHNRAAAVLLRVNTFGGRVDVATEIKDAVLDAGVPTLAFVDGRAISAGALITISAEKIAMAPGSSIGAATPVYGDGEKASEKVVSYMRGEMRATAERHNRDPKIAEAMVDESLTLEDSTYKRAGQLLTLTASEALDVGYCDVTASSVEEALEAFGYPNAVIIRTEASWSEELVRFLTKPFMSSLLIMLGLGGLFYGLKTGHFGTVASIGVTSIALFFGAQYLNDMATVIEVLLFVGGVVLLALEIFVIPGFGVAGILGIVMLFSSLFLALISGFDLLSMETLTVPLYTLAASFIGLVILGALMVKYLPSSKAFGRIVLQTNQSADQGYVSSDDYSLLVGREGEAVTTLRPAGVALVDGDRVDVVTEGEYIGPGEMIRIVRVEGRRIIVRRINAPQAEKV